jgi:hypothetical protein
MAALLVLFLKVYYIFKMKVPAGIISFVLFYLGIIFYMVRGSQKNRELVKEVIGTISSSFILVSIFMMVYNEYLKAEELKKKRVMDLNSVNNQLLGGIYGMFLQRPSELHKLHEEIFKSPSFDTNKKANNNTNPNVSLTYYEYIALQIIFTIFLNIFRQYTISGGESTKATDDLYESLDILIKQTTRSPKAITFWNNNKKQFNSLGFIQWMDNKYFGK